MIQAVSIMIAALASVASMDCVDAGGPVQDREGRASAGPELSAQQSIAVATAIFRQLQPCADRQVNPGPGAERIRVEVALQLNRDGSLARPPRIVRHEGVDEANQRYVPKVDEAVRAIFTECSPLRGLPAELYDVPRGWKKFTLRYRLKN